MGATKVEGFLARADVALLASLEGYRIFAGSPSYDNCAVLMGRPPLSEIIERYCGLVEETSGLRLKSRYAHLRHYTRGGTFGLHQDNGGPTVSVSVTIAYPGGVDPWPLEVDGEMYALAPGSAVVFDSLLVHGRRKSLRYDWHRQLILHYARNAPGGLEAPSGTAP